MTQFSAVDYRYASGQVGGFVDRLAGGDGSAATPGGGANGAGDAPIAPPRPPPRPPPSRNVIRADPASFGDHDERLKRRQEQKRERERIRMEQDLPLEKRPIMKGMTVLRGDPHCTVAFVLHVRDWAKNEYK